MLELVSQEQQYDQLLSLIAKRNTVHLRVQEALGAANVPNGAMIGQEDMRRIIGAVLEKNLVDLTDSVIEGVDSCALSSRVLIEKLTAFSRAHFRDIGILELKKPVSPANQAKV